jgi:hypothetical protein
VDQHFVVSPRRRVSSIRDARELEMDRSSAAADVPWQPAIADLLRGDDQQQQQQLHTATNFTQQSQPQRQQQSTSSALSINWRDPHPSPTHPAPIPFGSGSCYSMFPGLGHSQTRALRTATHGPSIEQKHLNFSLLCERQRQALCQSQNQALSLLCQSQNQALHGAANTYSDQDAFRSRFLAKHAFVGMAASCLCFNK